MRIIQDFTELDDCCRRGALTIGNFDGVHRGHARLVAQVVHSARAADGPAVAMTFDPHPARLLRPHEAPPPLTWPDRKADLLGELGIDVLIAYPTTLELLQKSAEDFFHSIVVGQFHARAMVEGPNFFFGHERRGDIRLLRSLCEARGIALTVVPPLEWQGEFISSSRIRDAIRCGDVSAAATMLTHPYCIRGMVTHGARRGTQLGFPTANLDAIDTLIPAVGVYAGRAVVRRRDALAAISVGASPTFGEPAPKVEVHLIDFHDSIYGEPVVVHFHKWLRGMQTFPSPEALVEQLARDVAETRQVMSA